MFIVPSVFFFFFNSVSPILISYFLLFVFRVACSRRISYLSFSAPPVLISILISPIIRCLFLYPFLIIPFIPHRFISSPYFLFLPIPHRLFSSTIPPISPILRHLLYSSYLLSFSSYSTLSFLISIALTSPISRHLSSSSYFLFLPIFFRLFPSSHFIILPMPRRLSSSSFFLFLPIPLRKFPSPNHLFLPIPLRLSPSSHFTILPTPRYFFLPSIPPISSNSPSLTQPSPNLLFSIRQQGFRCLMTREAP